MTDGTFCKLKCNTKGHRLIVQKNITSERKHHWSCDSLLHIADENKARTHLSTQTVEEAAVDRAV